MGYGSFDNIPGNVNTLIESFLPFYQGVPGLLLNGVCILTQHNLHPQRDVKYITE